MKIKLTLLAILVCSLSFTLKVEKDKQIKEMLQGIMQKEHIPGLAYSVVKDGKVICKGTLGKASIPYNIDVTENTVFQLASCSKIYTSLLLSKLFEKGLLKPAATLHEVLDSIPESWNNITILQLSAHQSGIKILDFSQAHNSQEAFMLARKMPFEFQPGEKSSYVSSDYWILQHIIEKVTGLKYYQALKKFVLDPLSLRHTFVNNAKMGHFTDLDIVPFQAQEYHWFKEDSTLRINQMWFVEPDYAAGGIYSSIDDLTAVAIALDRKEFINKDSYDLISNPVKLNDGKDGSFGMGLVVRDYEGHKIVEHSGGPALADFVKFEKEGYTFIVLTNNRGVYPYMTKAIATLFIPGLKYPEVPTGWQ